MADEQFNLIMDDVRTELYMATSEFGPFSSPHEGFAILKEEVDELWDDIKANKDPRNEAIQVAAMAVRFLMDCCDEYR
jgi:hypothetical protein